MGRRYRTGEPASLGDHVKLTRRWAEEHGEEFGYVTDLHGYTSGRGLEGFITVILTSGRMLDFDARAVIFLSNEEVVR